MVGPVQNKEENMTLVNEIRKSMNKIEEKAEVTELSFELKKVQKTNVELDAIIFKGPELSASPTFYLDSLEQIYQDGIDELVDFIAFHLAEAVGYSKKIQSLTAKLNKEYIKNNVTCKVINYERNLDMLSNLPHRRLLDLAIIYNLSVDELKTENSCIATLNVTDAIAENCGICEEELYEWCKNNIQGTFVHMSLEQVVQSLFEDVEKDSESVPPFTSEECPTMTVITNHTKMHGATALVDTECIREVADRVGSDLFILPSSVHEVLALSTDIGSPFELANMVSCVNDDCVDVQDYLSDNVYLYRRSDDKLYIAS